MRFFQWLKSRFEMAPLNRVSAVNCHSNLIELKWSGGSTASIAIDDIRRVVIRTTDRGPFDDDVFFVIEATTGRFVIPQQAAVAGDLLSNLQELPGFDHEAVIESIGCVENREFLCWEKV
jgi:hypothetical protein